MSKDENPQRENEMDSPSFEAFHVQLYCQLEYGNKNQTAHTRIVYIFSCSKTKQNKAGIMKNIAKLA